MVERLVKLVVGEYPREAPELGDMIGWNGDQKVLAESFVCAGEARSKYSCPSRISESAELARGMLCRTESSDCWLGL